MAKGKKKRGEAKLRVIAGGADQRAPRFGFIISKQVGTAVVRNTVRRRLKAVCAEFIDMVPEGTDVVIRALPASATADFEALRADVERCLRRVLPGSARA